VAGAEHFRTAVAKGVEIISALRGWTSGLGIPHYVIDAPGGGGKIPILPEYVQSMSATEVVLRNYAGEEFRYPLPRTPIPAGEGDVPSIPERIAARQRVRTPRKKGGGRQGPAANGRRKAKKSGTDGGTLEVLTLPGIIPMDM
jgi:hypothetical protein